jgi:hypothetical protein
MAKSKAIWKRPSDFTQFCKTHQEIPDNRAKSQEKFLGLLTQAKERAWNGEYLRFCSLVALKLLLLPTSNRN